MAAMPRNANPDPACAYPSARSFDANDGIAIVTNPDTLFADEPTGNLDSKTTHEIMELLRHLNTDRGISIIMVTHEKDVAVYAKRHIHVLDGLIDQDSGS